MKRILLLISVVALAINSMAWEPPYNPKTFKTDQSLKGLTTSEPLKTFTNTDDLLTSKFVDVARTAFGETIITFSNGPEPIAYYYKPGTNLETGIFVGQTFGGNTGYSSTHWNVNLSCYTRNATDLMPKPVFIKSARIRYTYINDNVINIKSDKSCDVEVVQNGHEVEINPLIPTKSLFLTIDEQKEVSSSSSHARAFMGGTPLNGVIINSITLELVTESSVGAAAKDYSDYVNILNTSFAKVSGQQTANGNNYTTAHKGDINQDGQINVTDVVSLYNNIIGGVPTYKNHEYVDLGLPSHTMWATCNAGAYTPTDAGDFFAWYEFDNSFFNGKVIFNETNRKYNDALKAPKGWEGWIMPTKEQYDELISNTTLSVSNNCIILKSKHNDNSITFPATGFVEAGFIQGRSPVGYYWTDSAVDGQDAKIIYIQPSTYTFKSDTDHKYMGNAVRLVFKQ